MLQQQIMHYVTRTNRCNNKTFIAFFFRGREPMELAEIRSVALSKSGNQDRYWTNSVTGVIAQSCVIFVQRSGGLDRSSVFGNCVKSWLSFCTQNDVMQNTVSFLFLSLILLHYFCSFCRLEKLGRLNRSINHVIGKWRMRSSMHKQRLRESACKQNTIRKERGKRAVKEEELQRSCMFCEQAGFVIHAKLRQRCYF